MNNGTKKISLKLTKNEVKRHFSVGKFSPFVCSPKTTILPFVGIYQPFNQFTANTSPAPSRSRGFSLIELIVTMVVVAIVAAIVMPNIRVVIKDSRISTQINGLKADLNYARSEAIKRRSDVVVCQSANGTACIGAAGDWKDGRLIFVDANKDGVLAANETVLRYREAVGGDDRILKVTGNDPVIFIENGGTKTAPGNTLTTFTICDEQGATKGKSINLNPTGLTTTLPAAPATCN